MKFNVSICYHIENISRGSALHALDYFVLNGMTSNDKSFGKSNANRICSPANVYGIMIYQDTEVVETSLPFIHFSNTVDKPVFKSKNQVISPIDYSWIVSVERGRSNATIIDGRYCYPLSRKEDNLKKDKITQNLEHSSSIVTAEKKKKIEETDIVNPVKEIKSIIKKDFFSKI